MSVEQPSSERQRMTITKIVADDLCPIGCFAPDSPSSRRFTAEHLATDIRHQGE